MNDIPEFAKLTPSEWAEWNSLINKFGPKYYSPGICVTLNMVEETIRKCGYAFGFVPEAGCPVHDRFNHRWASHYRVRPFPIHHVYGS